MEDRVISKPIISADSHIMEPPDTYSARIDRKYKETAPHVIWDDKRGDTYVVEGMKETVPMGHRRCRQERTRAGRRRVPCKI
jgi:uncharacterized protein